MINNEGKTDIAALHHYKYLSKKEWNTKNCIRGDVMGKERELKHICSGKEPDPYAGEIFNDDAWQFLRAHVPTYQEYDNVTELG